MLRSSLMSRLLFVCALFSTAASAADPAPATNPRDPFSAISASANAKAKAGHYAEAAQEWDAAIAATPEALEWSRTAAREAADELRFRVKLAQGDDATSHRSLVLSLLVGKPYLDPERPGDPGLTAQLKALRKVDPAFESLTGKPISVDVERNDLDEKGRDLLRDQLIAGLKAAGLDATRARAPSALSLHAKWTQGPAKTGLRTPFDEGIPDKAYHCGVEVQATFTSGGPPLHFSDSANQLTVDGNGCHQKPLEQVAEKLVVKLLREALAAAASAH